MDDQRGNRDSGESVHDIDVLGGLENPRGHLRRRRDAHKIAEPAFLLFARIRHEHGGEHLAKRRVLLTPSQAHQLVERAKLASDLLTAVLPATRERTVQHQVRDALGVADGVLDRNGASLRYAYEGEAINVCGLHDRFEVGHLRGK